MPVGCARGLHKVVGATCFVRNAHAVLLQSIGNGDGKQQVHRLEFVAGQSTDVKSRHVDDGACGPCVRSVGSTDGRVGIRRA